MGHRVVRGALVALAISCCAALAGVGCSSTGSPPSLQDGCAQYESIVRGRDSVCYGVAPEPDESTLEARAAEVCVLVSGAPGSTVDGSFWADCAATASNECQGYDCQVPAGTRAAGQPCLVSYQCASLACVGTPILGADGTPLPKGLQCGTCAAIVADGAACDPTKDACATTSSCFGGVCRPRGLRSLARRGRDRHVPREAVRHGGPGRASGARLVSLSV